MSTAGNLSGNLKGIYQYYIQIKAMRKQQPTLHQFAKLAIKKEIKEKSTTNIKTAEKVVWAGRPFSGKS
jgi:hypothetical protein